MIAALLKMGFAVIVGLTVTFALAWVYNSFDSPSEPLLMTAEHVEPWPFREDTVQVTCCTVGQVSVLLPGNGQLYSFKGGRWSDRFPVTRIGKEGLTLDDFEPARVAAEGLARERWPEDFNRSSVQPAVP